MLCLLFCSESSRSIPTFTYCETSCLHNFQRSSINMLGTCIQIHLSSCDEWHSQYSPKLELASVHTRVPCESVTSTSMWSMLIRLIALDLQPHCSCSWDSILDDHSTLLDYHNVFLLGLHLIMYGRHSYSYS